MERFVSFRFENKSVILPFHYLFFHFWNPGTVQNRIQILMGRLTNLRIDGLTN